MAKSKKLNRLFLFVLSATFVLSTALGIGLLSKKTYADATDTLAYSDERFEAEKVKPFWMNDVMWNEACLALKHVSDGTNEIYATLAEKPIKVLRVADRYRNLVFTEGTDYVVDYENKRLYFPEGSAILQNSISRRGVYSSYVLDDRLCHAIDDATANTLLAQYGYTYNADWRAAADCGLYATQGSSSVIYVKRTPLFYERYLDVSYSYNNSALTDLIQDTGAVARSGGQWLPSVKNKIRSGSGDFNILVFGDSITAGCTTSGTMTRENEYPNIMQPNQPAYPTLVANEIQRLNPNLNVNMVNIAVGGMTSAFFNVSTAGTKFYEEGEYYGADKTRGNKAVTSHDLLWYALKDGIKYDLVIVAFGMNDYPNLVSGAYNAETYKNNILGIVDTVKGVDHGSGHYLTTLGNGNTLTDNMRSPDAEVILLGSFQGNPDAYPQQNRWQDMYEKLYEIFVTYGANGKVAFDRMDLLSAHFHQNGKVHAELNSENVNHPHDFFHRVYAMQLMAQIYEDAYKTTGANDYTGYSADFSGGLPSDWALSPACDGSNVICQKSGDNLQIGYKNDKDPGSDGYYGAVYEIAQSLGGIKSFALDLRFKVITCADESRWLGLMYHTDKSIEGDLSGAAFVYRYSGNNHCSAIGATRNDGQRTVIFNDFTSSSHAAGPNINDGAFHDLYISFDAETGVVSHYMDGVLCDTYSYDYIGSLIGGVMPEGGLALIVNRSTIEISALSVSAIKGRNSSGKFAVTDIGQGSIAGAPAVATEINALPQAEAVATTERQYYSYNKANGLSEFGGIFLNDTGNNTGSLFTDKIATSSDDILVAEVSDILNPYYPDATYSRVAFFFSSDASDYGYPLSGSKGFGVYLNSDRIEAFLNDGTAKYDYNVDFSNTLRSMFVSGNSIKVTFSPAENVIRIYYKTGNYDYKLATAIDANDKSAGFTSDSELHVFFAVYGVFSSYVSGVKFYKESTVKSYSSQYILNVNANMQVVSRDGEIISYKAPVLKDFIDTYAKGNLVAVRLNSSNYSAFISYANANDFKDMAVICSDDKILKAVRSACPKIRGYLDFTGETVKTEEDFASVVHKTASAKANVAILSPAQATKTAVDYIQSRLITVWVDAGDYSMGETSEIINSGAFGIITDSPDKVNGFFNEYKNYGYALVRTPLDIAHRGTPKAGENYSSSYENSLEGCIAAYENGATHIEIDGRLTKDGEIVIMHDDTIDRTTNGTGAVADMTLAQIRQYKIIRDMAGNIVGDGVNIPTLREFFEYFSDTDLIFAFEIKTSDVQIVYALKSLIEEYGMQDKIFVVTFYHSLRAVPGYIVDTMRSVLPEIPVAVLEDISMQQYVTGEAGYANYALLDCVPDVAFVDDAAIYKNETIARGYMPFSWTYDEKTSIWFNIAGGVYGMTNNYAQNYASYPKTLTLKDDDGMHTDKFGYGDVNKALCTLITYDGTESTVIADLFSLEEHGNYATAVYSYRTTIGTVPVTVFTDKITYHIFHESDWIIDSEPDFEHAGKRHKECTFCHKHTVDEIIPSTGFLSLSLDKDLTLSYKVYISDNYTAPQAEITFRSEKILIDEYEIIEGGYVFRFSVVTPRYLNVDINFKATAINIVTGERETVHSHDCYSVRDYLETLLELYSDNDAIVSLVVDILNYGAAIQIYTDTATDDLANKNLTEKQREKATPFDASAAQDILYGTNSSLFTFNGVNMVFNAKAELEYRITVDSSVDKNAVGVRFTVNGRAYTVALKDCEYKNGRYFVRFAEFAASEFADTITAEIFYNGVYAGAFSEYSVNSYIKRSYEKESIADVVKALYSYGAGVKAYIGNDNLPRDINFDGSNYKDGVPYTDDLWIAPNYEYCTDLDFYVTTPDVNGEKTPNVRGLFFDSPVEYEGRKTKVAAYIGFPQGASATDKVPAVVLVHGALGTAIPQWVQYWNNLGYAAISIDTEGAEPINGVTNTNNAHNAQNRYYNGAIDGAFTCGPSNNGFSDDYKTLTEQWMYHATSATILAVSLISSFECVDTQKIGITGISWGSVITSIVLGYDDRISFAMPVYGGISIIGSSADLSNLFDYCTDPTTAQRWNNTDALSKTNAKTFYVTGMKDFAFSQDIANTCAKASGGFVNFKTDFPHGQYEGAYEENLPKFADYFCNRGAFVEILQNPTKENPILKLKRYGTATVNSVKLFYTDSETTDYNTSWNFISVPVSENDVYDLLIPYCKHAFVMVEYNNMFTVCSYMIDNVELTDFTVEIHEDRDPVVLMLSDTQIIDAAQQRSDSRLNGAYSGPNSRWSRASTEDRLLRYIREAVEKSNPDLILLVGDNIYGEFDDSGYALTYFIEFMDSFGIPWAPVMGNHDMESKKGADWICAQYENAQNCLFKRNTLTGNGNYSIGITHNGKLIRTFFMLDSASSRTASYRNPIGFAQDEIKWYTRKMAAIKRADPDTGISIMTHIPMQVALDFLTSNGFTNTTNAPVDFDADPDNGIIGIANEWLGGVWDADYSVWKGLKKLGVDSMFFGHVHGVSAGFTYDGVRIQFGLKTGTYDALNYRTEDGGIFWTYSDGGDPITGATVISVSKNDGSVSTYHILTELEEEKTFDEVLDPIEKDSVLSNVYITQVQAYGGSTQNLLYVKFFDASNGVCFTDVPAGTSSKDNVALNNLAKQIIFSGTDTLSDVGTIVSQQDPSRINAFILFTLNDNAPFNRFEYLYIPAGTTFECDTDGNGKTDTVWIFARDFKIVYDPSPCVAREGYGGCLGSGHCASGETAWHIYGDKPIFERNYSITSGANYYSSATNLIFKFIDSNATVDLGYTGWVAPDADCNEFLKHIKLNGESLPASAVLQGLDQKDGLSLAGISLKSGDAISIDKGASFTHGNVKMTLKVKLTYTWNGSSYVCTVSK